MLLPSFSVRYPKKSEKFGHHKERTNKGLIFALWPWGNSSGISGVFGMENQKMFRTSYAGWKGSL